MKQIRFRFKLVALLLLGLFAVLMVYGTYSIAMYGNRWFAYTRNPRIREQKQMVQAGDILDRNGVVLATSVSGQRLYHGDAATRRALVHLLGDEAGHVSNGVESFQTAYLYGFHTSLAERFAALWNDEPRRGDDVILTVDSGLSVAITEFFSQNRLTRGKNGAAVVMNYKTGELLAEVSLPNFDPMDSGSIPADSEVYWNRATQSLYPPGSTFKVVSTAAALKRLPGVSSMQMHCSGALAVQNTLIHDFGGASHGTLTLNQAFVKSCNNIFAGLALDMGDEALRRTAESFGFNDNFLFRDLVVENSVYPTVNRTDFEVATSGFGQSSIGATPMHMCLIASAIANDGSMVEPILLKRVVSPTGSVRLNSDTASAALYREAIDAATAETLQGYMRQVVTSGTGTRAAVSGLTVCGKTGSAETSRAGRDVTHGLFIGYAADEELPIAVAVVVEDIADGEGGGSTAAVIAGNIFTWLRDNREQVIN